MCMCLGGGDQGGGRGARVRATRHPPPSLARLAPPHPLPPPPHPPPHSSYDDAEVALNCGAMLRDCTRHEAIARAVLESEMFPEMFDKLELSNFEVASGERVK